MDDLAGRLSAFHQLQVLCADLAFRMHLLAVGFHRAVIIHDAGDAGIRSNESCRSDVKTFNFDGALHGREGNVTLCDGTSLAFDTHAAAAGSLGIHGEWEGGLV